MAQGRTSRLRLRELFLTPWRTCTAGMFACAAAAYALGGVSGATPVQHTLLGWAQAALWTGAAACAALAAALYALRRHRVRKANPYARHRLGREPCFDMPYVGRNATMRAVGEPFLRIRELPPAPAPGVWSVALLQALEWKRFELLCASYYGERAFRVTPVASAAGAGCAALLYYRQLAQPVAVLACRAMGSRPAGVKVVRELHDLMEVHGVGKGICHVTGDYTAEAQRYAAARRVQLVSGEAFVASLLALPAPVQQALLQLVTAGDYRTPSCPSCGEKMMMCTSDYGDFWGCSSYPQCKATLAVADAAW